MGEEELEVIRRLICEGEERVQREAEAAQADELGGECVERQVCCNGVYYVESSGVGLRTAFALS